MTRITLREVFQFLVVQALSAPVELDATPAMMSCNELATAGRALENRYIATGKAGCIITNQHRLYRIEQYRLKTIDKSHVRVFMIVCHGSSLLAQY